MRLRTISAKGVTCLLPAGRKSFFSQCVGWVAERFKAPVLKNEERRTRSDQQQLFRTFFKTAPKMLRRLDPSWATSLAGDLAAAPMNIANNTAARIKQIHFD
jgi:hypothetical protein